MDITSNNINQNQINQNNSYNNANYQTTNIDNNYMNGNKGGTPYTGNMVTQPNGNIVQPSPPQYIPQNNNQSFWNGNYNKPMQNIQYTSVQSDIQNQDEKEFILLDGSTPNAAENLSVNS